MNDDAGRQKVIIFTRHFEIKGDLAIYQGVRLTDYMNESKSFVSVTDVEVKDRSGEMRFKAKFLNVRRDEIVIILPEDSLINAIS
jgi:hypothetical protein